MKKNDITLVVSTIVVAAILALIITSASISKLVSTNQQVTTVTTINATFNPPSSKYLNSNSIDPTLLVTIGGNANTSPFSQ
jgi:hypothetical protein